MFFYRLIISRWRSVVCVCFGLSSCLGSVTFAAEYTLQAAIQIAQAQDPWLQTSLFRQQSLAARSISAGTLPNPSVHLGVSNLPLDSFSFSQDGMSQLKLGISQKFPRGDSRALQQTKLEQLSLLQPLARADRKAQVAMNVTHLWLEVFRSQQSMALIVQDQGLFEHLVDVVQSSYSSATGPTLQQDVIRAQLALTRLEDRVSVLQHQRDSQLAKLSEWLVDPDISIQVSGDGKRLVPPIDEFNMYQLSVADQFSTHPKVLFLNQQLAAAKTDIELARQSYQPEWGLNASYGLRGNHRSDLFSIGLSVDVPLFSDDRQDHQIRAAIAEQQAILSERTLVLRQLQAGFATAKADYVRLTERKALFDDRLLNELAEQAEATLTAYTNDNGSFADVMRARIGELNARIEAFQIEIDRQKALAQLHYFLVGATSDE